MIRRIVLSTAAGQHFPQRLPATGPFRPVEPVEKNASLIFGFFMGIMLSAAAYLFFIWIVMRERGQVFLLCLLLSLCAYIASSNDFLMGQIGLHDESMRSLFATYSMVLSCIFSTCFTFYFLEIELYCPSLRTPSLGGVMSAARFYFCCMFCSIARWPHSYCRRSPH